MTRRKIIGASLFFTLFGAIAIFPPVIWLFQTDDPLFGVPLEVLYIFGLWIALVIGALRFAAALPFDEPSSVESWDKDQ
ncbi:hypothetical protein [Pelagibacterium xiamenense]|uniref:hypothetical protein n=1 Tax=Pelagibacterium xiamenense TaxID=2901140 RepID=UPI001E2EF4DD|nr:hypothetical protein [Pelagibacterium xiamenense]MCD7059834.1 hypothetical protein [Pelagibacterium xiamenense]